MSYEGEFWHPEDDRAESVMFRLGRPGYLGPIQVWAGDELDPAYLTPKAARQAADEWPEILRRLADEAEKEGA